MWWPRIGEGGSGVDGDEVVEEGDQSRIDLSSEADARV